MHKTLIGLLLAGSLSLLPTSTARGDENTGLSVSQDVGWDGIAAAPVPYQHTIHWLNFGFGFTKRPNVLDAHVGLFSPLLINPKALAMQLSSSLEIASPQLGTFSRSAVPGK
jgi:hypothetical protein